eukprot:TRINITY_DN12365_c2_g1_i1.p1 TRINITY_DN12365_c2_g1~~TRINITY_DN12365_c2_g1_i1.p1  ORF type:complete len:310 (-),score=32.60 TRINITY_DN12365_c2_g1_i1:100-1029(-)
MSTDLLDTFIVQVIWSGEDGDQKMSFNVRPSTPFSKLMDAWCGQVGAPVEKVRFVLGSREITREDTPATAFGHGIGLFLLPKIKAPPPRIWAVPRRDHLLGGETPPQRRPALVPGHQRRGGTDKRPIIVDDGLDEVSEVGPSSDEETESSDSDDDDSATRKIRSGSPVLQDDKTQPDPSESGRIHFRVVATTSDRGDNVTEFSMGPDVPMARLMMAWCNLHRLGPGAALFKIGVKELVVTDTPLSLAIESVIPEHLVGVTPGPGTASSSTTNVVEVQAIPRRRRMLTDVTTRQTRQRPSEPNSFDQLVS